MCVKVFVSNSALERHLEIGKHFYRLQNESAYDTIKKKWSSKCTSVNVPNIPEKQTKDTSQPNDATEERIHTAEMGWALRKPSAKTRFSKPIKDLLLSTFLDGAKSGRKADPKEVASKIKTIKRGRKKLFDKSQWLTAQQVKSYFSRLSVLQKTGKLSLTENEEEEEADQEIEMMQEAFNRHSLFERVREEVEL